MRHLVGRALLVVTLGAGLHGAAPATGAQVSAAVRASLSIKAIPSNLTPSLQQVATQQGYWHALSTTYIKNNCNAWNTPVLRAAPRACFYGDLASRRTVILYGDSNAANWAPALDLAFKSLGVRLALVAMPGCDAGFMTYTTKLLQNPHACMEWHDHLAPLARSLKPAAVLLVSAGWVFPTPQGWTPAIVRAFDVVTGGAKGVKRILVGTSPFFQNLVPQCLASFPTAVQRCTLDYSNQSSPYAQVLARDRQLATAAHALLQQVFPWLCDAHRCSTIVRNMMVYVDRDHTSIVYSQYLAGVFATAMKRDGL